MQDLTVREIKEFQYHYPNMYTNYLEIVQKIAYLLGKVQHMEEEIGILHKSMTRTEKELSDYKKYNGKYGD